MSVSEQVTASTDIFNMTQLSSITDTSNAASKKTVLFFATAASSNTATSGCLYNMTLTMNTDGSFAQAIQHSITIACHDKMVSSLSTVYLFQKQFAYFSQQDSTSMVALNVFGPDVVGRLAYPVAGIFGRFNASVYADSFSSPDATSVESVLYVGTIGPQFGQNVTRFVVAASIVATGSNPSRFLSEQKATITVKSQQEINTGVGGSVDSVVETATMYALNIKSLTI